MRRRIDSRGEQEQNKCYKARLQTSPAKAGKLMRLRPTFNDDFFLCEEIYSIPALTVEVTEEAILPTAEGEERHRCRNAEVNSDIADLRLVAEFPRSCAAAGE